MTDEGKSPDTTLTPNDAGVIEIKSVIKPAKAPDFLANISFANETPSDPVIDQKISEIALALLANNSDVNPFVLDYFGDPRFFNSLPLEIRGDNQLLGEYVTNMSRFYSLIGRERTKRATGDISGLFAESIDLPESMHGDGRVRRAEKGYRINVDYVRSIGIDPSKVLFFRLTQPMGDVPKPEYYWSSDFHEATKGLTQEVSPEQRSSAITLIDSLDGINKNGGLIQDINDDSGISVRQIGTGSYDQNAALASFKAI